MTNFKFKTNINLISINLLKKENYMDLIAFIDSEVSITSYKIMDLGAVKSDNSCIHTSKLFEFSKFVYDCKYICGHNIIHHDLKYTSHLFNKNSIFIDTLYLSALLFPCKPYHKLIKDDKIDSEDLNNPLNDAKKAEDIFYDEVEEFKNLKKENPNIADIYCSLLYDYPEFQGFFKFNNQSPSKIDSDYILSEFKGLICANADMENLLSNYKLELAYALSLIKFGNEHSIMPVWILKNYPYVENILKTLKFTPCLDDCPYCNERLDAHKALKRHFGYDDFRKYNGENLQEQAVKAGIRKKSLIAIFPTGGGKSITFQLPAIMAGETIHSLTIIISPLQSLMKDQVDNLEKNNIVDAVTINGLLSPLERADAINRVLEGSANILYISPEQLRSKTIEKIVLSRTIERFVIDEAHCFSAWGHDFRVDYLYIGDFIKNIQKQKALDYDIPISCFTATAKQKVISDIKDYFKKYLDIELDIYATDSTRKNLTYYVLYKETEEEKYSTMRELIQEFNCPTIVYVSRTKKTFELSEKLNKDGISSKHYHGKMDSNDKISNQEQFIKNEVQVIVATSAFGMGVDKDNVGLVIHYDISNSLENYVQEAGRAGRNPNLEAKCYVLFNENDLDKHFALLNQTKLNMSEIQQIWKAIKDLTKTKRYFSISPLELARYAGWDDSTFDIETRVKTALGALENSGYIKRGKNTSHIYATSILVKNMQEAVNIIDNSDKLTFSQKQNSKLIIKSLISNKHTHLAKNNFAESRIDYLSDIIGISKSDVIDSINLMREQGLLADTKDMSVQIFKYKTRAIKIFENFKNLEKFILERINKDIANIDIKQLNEDAINQGIDSSTKNIRTIFFYWYIKNYIQKKENNSNSKVEIIPKYENHILKEKYKLKIDICTFILDEFYKLKDESKINPQEDIILPFSLIELYHSYSVKNDKISIKDVENSLLYLSKIGEIKLEGGFLVIYNTMEITKLISDNKVRYKVKDYSVLNDFYKQKIQQIHIVGEYVNMIVKNYEKALQFVKDYFQIEFKEFIEKYFGKQREGEICRNISKHKYDKLFSNLSDVQSQIINDNESDYIVVAAGPGSGKTLVLVHKLASLLLLEDIKQEQLLMLTFSRAAATEFKKRLIDLIGSVANYVEIKTFHSYCFDLLGTRGNLEKSENVVKNARQMIINGEVETGRITKRVIVIDEAQDMDKDEFELIEALILLNEDIRVIAVGDDDQNIYEFRGSDTKFFKAFIDKYNAVKYEMTTNYRSDKSIVNLSNIFVQSIKNRMKTIPCISHTKNYGEVSLIKHKSDYLEQAVILDILNNYDKKLSTCILTNTNEESLKLACILKKKSDISFKIIQSNDGVSLYNFAEIRYFLKQVNKYESLPKISNELWESSKEKLIKSYFQSNCLENCLRLIDDFSLTNPDKYKSDLEHFIRESSYEDFYKNDKNEIFISTIHKAKGREFDKVYLLMNKVKADKDSEKRKIFVGLTRAKKQLNIHYNNNLFDNIDIKNMYKSFDEKIYDDTDEIILQLSHRDVSLSFFKDRDRKNLILRLRSGQKLEVQDNYMCINYNGRKIRILQFSKKFIQILNAKKEKGYLPHKAYIRFILAWKDKEEQYEAAIILPDLYMKKSR